MSTARKYDHAELPHSWRLVRLGDVAKVRKGQSFTSRELIAGDVPVIAGGTSPAYYHAYSNREANTITVSASGANAGFVAYHHSPIFATDCSTISETDTSESIAFLNQVLKYNQASLLYRRRGSAQPHVYPEDVCSLPIFLPPLAEQRAIADVLDSIDEAIERTEAVIAATETLRDSLLHELLTRGVPGWHTEWKDVPGIGTIPADWEVMRLGECVTHVGSGVTPRGGKSVYTTTGITFLRSQNVHFDGLRLDDVVCIPQEIDDAMRRSRVKPDDVLLNITGASIGRCTTPPVDMGPANVNQHVCIIRTTEALNPRFLSKWLSTPRSQKEIDDIQTGQSRQGLNYQQVRQLSMVLPPRDEQDSVVQILGGVDATIDMARNERDGLRLLKDSTADGLLAGRVSMGS